MKNYKKLSKNDENTHNLDKNNLKKIDKEPETDFLNEKNYKIFNEDAMTIVDMLIKNNVKVNHIITDPPYSISKKNNFGTLKHPRTGINFGEWDKDFDLFSWIPKYSQVLDKNGSMIVFCSYRYISFIIKTMEESGLEVKDVIVWRKSNPMPRNIDRRYVQDMEFAIWAVKKNAKWTFNKLEGHKYMRSLYETSLVSGNEKLAHPTQKSLKLMQELILVHTNVGDTILDPFMGTATTGIASLKNGRKFIGIELSPEYFEMAKNRIEETNF